MGVNMTPLTAAYKRVPRLSEMRRKTFVSMSGLMALAFNPNPVLAQGESATSVEQGATPMEDIEMANPQTGFSLVGPPERPEERSPFLNDAKFSAQLRSVYFNREKYNNSNRSEAWALGGSLSVKSGYLADRLGFGAVAYTSQPLYAPEDRDGTFLLKPGQDGYAALGQLYGEYKFTDRIFGAFGDKEYSTPYMNKSDSRMTPNTFEGVSVYGKAGGGEGEPAWRFGGGYITKIKERNADHFVWMSRDAGASADRGVYIAGANFERGDFSLGAINYYSGDIINIFYSEGYYAIPLVGDKQVKLEFQFTDQRSTGNNLLTGQEFSTNQWGLKTDSNLGAALLTLAYTKTANDAGMRSPWSGYPGYTSVQVQDFNRAGESALMLRSFYDFSRLGEKGLSAYALWVHGDGVDAPNYNEDEADLNLQWTPQGGALRGMSFRARYAHVMQRGGGDPDINDFRIIVNYDFTRS
jgi:hypothetical protein